MNPLDSNEATIARIRRVAREQARDGMIARGIPTTHPDFVSALDAAESQAEENAAKEFRLATLKALADNKIGGVEYIANENDQKALGSPYVVPSGDVEDFVDLRVDQFLKGMEPIKWQSFNDNKRGAAASTWEQFLGGAVLSVEGMLSSTIDAALQFSFDWSPYTAPASASPAVKEAMLEAGQKLGQNAARGLTESMLGEQYTRELVGTDPSAPLLASEKYGLGGSRGGVGREIAGQAFDVGLAAGSLPASLPPMVGSVVGGPAGQAIGTAPFFLMGYGGSQQERLQQWKDQKKLAEELGEEPPPFPTLGEMQLQGIVGGVAEFGSEYVFDSLQFGAARMAFGKAGSPTAFSRTKLGSKLSGLGKSLSRSRGWGGVLKRGSVLLTAGPLTEGLEETVPQAANELKDFIGWANNPEYWDRLGGDRDFWSAETGNAFKVGAIAGLMFGGGAFVASEAVRSMQDRSTRKALRGGGSAAMVGSMVEGQVSDAVSRVRRSVVNARGSAMALAHVEQMGQGRRTAMFIHPDDRSSTLTDEVRERMTRLGISTTPIGTISATGAQVYTADADAEFVREALQGNVPTDMMSYLSGHDPLVGDGQVIGAITVRNAAMQIVDMIPYSDPAAAEAAIPAIQLSAQQDGYTVSVLEGADMANIPDQLNRQVDADAASRGIETRDIRAGATPRQEKRGMAVLRGQIRDAAMGSKRTGESGRPSRSDPFRSPYLTQEEVGDATNGDVTVSVVLSKVSDENKSEGEARLRSSTGLAPTILDGKVVFAIKNKDGSVRTVEKPINTDGAYISQASPDGLFLIRENGDAFTLRSAVAIAMHESRHRTISRSRAGALHGARLLHIDPVFAVRGGAAYMRQRYANAPFARMSDAAMVKYFQGMYEAAQKTLADQSIDTSTEDGQRKMAEAQAQMGLVRQFAEESVATTSNESLGTTTQKALDYEGVYKATQERSIRAFTAWFASVLDRSGFSGPESKQVIYEVQQRLANVREEEFKVHDDFRKRVEKALSEDLAKNRETQQRAQQEGQVPTGTGVPAQRQAGVSVPVTQQGQAPAAQQVSVPVPQQGQSGTAAPAIAPAAAAAGAIPAALLGGGDDEEKRKAISETADALERAKNAPPEEQASLLTKAMFGFANLLPSLMGAQATVIGGGAAPAVTPPSRRAIPAEAREQPRVTAPVPAGQATQPSDFDVEAYARRQRNAANAMRIIEGDQPTEPVELGTVQKIQRARTLYQTPEEEIQYSVRDRVGRRPANETIRSDREAYMADRGIVPEVDMRDQYAQVDEEFAKRVADWYESTPVNYDDPQMLAAYEAFGNETLDQYRYLVDRGYQIIPWAGANQPYANSADALDDLRRNKRLFYYKTINPSEASSFGSDPAKFDEAVRKNPLMRDAGVPVLDSEGNEYAQTYNDLFRAVHDIFGHGAEGFQFGERGEDNAFRSHFVMFSPLAQQAMGTETRGQNSWVNFGPNRRDESGNRFSTDDPRYAQWKAGFDQGLGFADQKPMLMPRELLALYSMRVDGSKRPLSRGNQAIINRINQEVSRGRMEQQDADFGIELVRRVNQNVPMALQFLGPTTLQRMGQPKEIGGLFSPTLESVIVNTNRVKDGRFSEVFTHEFWHSLTRFVPDKMIKRAGRDYQRAYIKFRNENGLEPRDFHNLSRVKGTNKTKRDVFLEEVAKRGISETDWYRLVNLDEWLVVNAAEATERRMDAEKDMRDEDGPWRLYSMLNMVIRDFLTTVKDVFGYGTYEKLARDFLRGSSLGMASKPDVEWDSAEARMRDIYNEMIDAQQAREESRIREVQAMRPEAQSVAQAPVEAMFSQRAETPEQAVARQRAAVSREEAVQRMAQRQKKPAQAQVSPTISVSPQVTSTRALNPNIIVPSMKADPTFDTATAYERANQRISGLLAEESFQDSLSRLAGGFSGTVSVVENRGHYGGTIEDSVEVRIEGAGHEETHLLARILGSAMFQDAVITTSEATDAMPDDQASVMVEFTVPAGAARKQIDTILANAGTLLGGAKASAKSGKIVSVFVKTDPNADPIAWLNDAESFAQANNLGVAYAVVRNQYSEANDYDIPSAVAAAPRVEGADPTQPAGGQGQWDLWIDPASQIVDTLQDEGFDINTDGWIDTIASDEADRQYIKEGLAKAIAKRRAERRHGLDGKFLTRYDGSMQKMGGRAKIPVKVTPANASSVFQKADELIARHPNALDSSENYARFMADMLGDRIVPMAPKDLIRLRQNNYEGMRRRMRLVSDGGILTQQQVSDAVHGLEMARKLGDLYKSGKAKPKHTVALAMWGFMSRGVSPMVQESMFLDIYNWTDASGRNLDYFVEKMLDGTYADETADEFIVFIEQMMQAHGWPVLDSQGQQVMETVKHPRTKAIAQRPEYNYGTAGAGATHNANSFSLTFLRNMGKKVKIDGVDQPAITHFHSELSSPQATTASIRRKFLALGGSMGIDNKVVSFISLLTGRLDGVVMDRVRIGDNYNADKALGNVYDGNTIGSKVFEIVGYETKNDKKVPILGEQIGYIAIEGEMSDEEIKARREEIAKAKGISPKMTKLESVSDGGMAGLFKGPRGDAIYRMVERNIDPTAVFSDLIKTNPEVRPFVSMGLLHWLEWVGVSNQEASHKTIEALTRAIESEDASMVGVFAKEGQYDRYMYGAEYGYDLNADGVAEPRYRYSIEGKTYQFSLENFQKFITDLSASSNWPSGFRVTKNENGSDRSEPWYNDPRIGTAGRQRIAEIAEANQTMFSFRNAVEAGAHPMYKNPRVTAANAEEIRQMFLDMVARKWPKPSFGANADLWLNTPANPNEAMEYSPHNGLWFHGSRAEYNVPNLDHRPAQFGFHVGSFNQAMYFYDDARKNDQYGYDRGMRSAVMYPLYVRAPKLVILHDSGYWKPNTVAESLWVNGYIDANQLREVIGEVGKAKSDSEKLGVVRSYIESLGYDAIGYFNGAEGYGFDFNDLKTDRDDIIPRGVYKNLGTIESSKPWTNPVRDNFSDGYERMISDEARAENGRRTREMFRMNPYQRALIIWNGGNIKSAGAQWFETTNNDIRFSQRSPDQPVETLYNGLLAPPTEAMFSIRSGIFGAKDAASLTIVDRYGELLRQQRAFERRTSTTLPELFDPYQGARVLAGVLPAMQKEAEQRYAAILRDMAKSNIDISEMDDFLTAQHALNGGNAYIASINPAFPDAGTGMSNADATNIINRHQASGRFGTMNRIAEDWRNMLREDLRNRRDAGLITPAMYTTLTTRYTHYVPLRGAPARPFDELFEDAGTVLGAGLSTQGRGMPRRFGRQSKAENVTSQVGFLHEDTLKRIARNEVGQRFLRLTLAINDNAFAQVIRPRKPVLVNGTTRMMHDDSWRDGENAKRNFGVYVNQPITINGHDYESGDLVVIQINNPRVAAGLLQPSREMTLVERGLNYAGNAFRFMTTGMGNPVFMPLNTAKDLQQGIANTIAFYGVKDAVSMVVGWAPAFWNVLTDSWLRPNAPRGNYAEFIKAGGDQLMWNRNDLEEKSADFDKIAARVARRDPNDRSLAGILLGWYPAMFDAAEKATRVSTFAVRRARGDSPERAALAARDITVDFAKGGLSKRSLNNKYMFFNAAVQGSATTLRAAASAPFMASTIVGLGYSMGVMARLFGGDDEELGGKRWDTRVSADDKARSMYFFAPDGSGRHFKVPLPYGYNALYAMGVHLADSTIGPNTSSEFATRVFLDSLNAFNPMSGSGITSGPSSLATAFLPTMLRPAGELIANRNYANRMIAPERYDRNEVRSERYFDNTAQAYVSTARFINRAAGGNEFESSGPFTDISPNQLQYLVGYYFSGTGRLIDRLYSAATKDTPVNVEDIPLARNFVGNLATAENTISQQYYEMGARIAPTNARMRAAKDPDLDISTRTEAAAGLESDDIALARMYSSSEKEMKRLRDALRRATPEQRERLLEARMAVMKRTIREANRLQGG